MKKLAVALAMCGALLCSQAQAKTFVGVLWPMFGPLPAIGLVELVAELKRLPDVEVKTYVHQAWPSLVEDLKHLPPGTHTLVVGYSLGANSSVFVANDSKYIDTIIALQPSLFSWNPPVTGKVGRYIEIYNPNSWETFGGMGSRKLIGPNIEYIANNDSHPGAQFDPQFRNLVKSELAKLTAEDDVETAQAETPKPVDVAAADVAADHIAADRGQIIDLHRDAAAKDRAVTARVDQPRAQQPKPVEVAFAQPMPSVSRQRGAAGEAPAQTAPAMPPEALALQPAELLEVADAQPAPRPRQRTAFLDTLTGAVDSGDLFVVRKPIERKRVERKLTVAEMMDYAKRTYGRRRPAIARAQRPPVSGMITTASVAFDRDALGGE
ncbi:MAG: hypothetical protein WAM75_07660 [Xanthobacteraceae bacterium]